MKPPATHVTVDPSGLAHVTGTDVQAALAQLDASVGGGGGGGSLGATRAYQSAPQNIPRDNATYTAITFTAEAFDDLSAHDNVTNPSRFTALATGRYRFLTQVALTAMEASKVAYVMVYKNSKAAGPRIAVARFSQTTAVGDLEMTCNTGQIALNAGDYLEAYVLAFGSGTNTTTTVGADSTWACFERIT